MQSKVQTKGLSKESAEKKAVGLSEIDDNFYLVIRIWRGYAVLNADNFKGEPDDERVESVFCGGILVG